MAISDFSDSYNSLSKSQRQKKKVLVRKQKKFKVYNWIFFATTFVPMLSVGLFNWTIDPYDLFNTPNWWGVNHEKIKKDNNDRLFKAVDRNRIVRRSSS